MQGALSLWKCTSNVGFQIGGVLKNDSQKAQSQGSAGYYTKHRLRLKAACLCLFEGLQIRICKFQKNSSRKVGEELGVFLHLKPYNCHPFLSSQEAPCELSGAERVLTELQLAQAHQAGFIQRGVGNQIQHS